MSTMILGLSLPGVGGAQGAPQSAGGTGQPPYAQSAAERLIEFHVPTQELDTALTRLADQAGVHLLFTSADVAALRSPELAGRYTLAQALSRALAGSGFTWRFTAADTVVLEKVPPEAAPGTMTLSSVRVEGDDVSGNSATTEGTGSYGSSVVTIAGKAPLTLKEIPQSVSVVTQQRIEDQNLITLDQAIQQTTGMVVQQGDSDRTYYYSRGFMIDTIQLDGVPTTINNPTSAQNLAMYDRVEVLRGPAGLLSGLGSPAGTINLVRKTPTPDFQMSDDFAIGSYSNVRDQFDVSGPLNAAGTLRARFVASLQTQNFAEDSAYRRDGQAYGILEDALSLDTTVRFGGSYQKVPQRAAWLGIPAYSDYRFVDAPRSTFYGAPWNDDVYSQTTGFAELERRFGNGWTGKGTVNYVQYEGDVVTAAVNSAVDPAANTADISANDWTQTDQQTAVDGYAAGPFSLFGRTHGAMFGFTASHDHLNVVNRYCDADNLFCDQTGNIFDLEIPKPAFDGPINQDITDTNQYALYGNVHLSIIDPLTVVLGGRILWWDSDYKPNPNENFFGDSRTDDRINAKPIPFAGLIYDVNTTYSLYISYADVFQPQTTRDVSGALLKPIEGEQYEAGVKSAFVQDRLNASLAVFQITQQNRAIADPNDPTGTIFFAQGRARTRGLETEISGKITPAWDIFAGYTYTQTENFDDSFNTDNGAAFSSVAPTHLLKLWTTYHLPSGLNRWAVGGGVTASSQFYNQDAGGRLTAGGYATVGLRLGYKLNEHLTASVNIDNATGRHYIYSLNGTQNGFLGAPRTALLTLHATY